VVYGVGDHEVGERRAKAPQRREDALTLLEVARVAQREDRDQLAVELGRHGQWWRGSTGCSGRVTIYHRAVSGGSWQAVATTAPSAFEESLAVHGGTVWVLERSFGCQRTAVTASA
jgi:hypothetical protein